MGDLIFAGDGEADLKGDTTELPTLHRTHKFYRTVDYCYLSAYTFPRAFAAPLFHFKHARAAVVSRNSDEEVGKKCQRGNGALQKIVI